MFKWGQTCPCSNSVCICRSRLCSGLVLGWLSNGLKRCSICQIVNDVDTLIFEQTWSFSSSISARVLDLVLSTVTLGSFLIILRFEYWMLESFQTLSLASAGDMWSIMRVHLLLTSVCRSERGRAMTLQTFFLSLLILVLIARLFLLMMKSFCKGTGPIISSRSWAFRRFCNPLKVLWVSSSSAPAFMAQ